MTTWLRLAAQFLLTLLLIAPPLFAAIIPADAFPIPEVSDGDDGGAVDDGIRVVHSPLGPPATPILPGHSVIPSARFRLLEWGGPRGLARQPSSSRSPPPR